MVREFILITLLAGVGIVTVSSGFALVFLHDLLAAGVCVIISGLLVVGASIKGAISYVRTW